MTRTLLLSLGLTLLAQNALAQSRTWNCDPDTYMDFASHEPCPFCWDGITRAIPGPCPAAPTPVADEIPTTPTVIASPVAAPSTNPAITPASTTPASSPIVAAPPTAPLH